MIYKFTVITRLKKQVSDPQGAALVKTARLLSFSGISEIRVGKHLELEVSAESAAGALEILKQFTEKMLYNPILEEYTIEMQENG